MRRSPVVWLVGILAVTAVLSACGSSVSAENLTGSEWQLEELNGRDVLDDVLVTMMLGEDDELSGTGGCNRFTGIWEVGEGREISLEAGGTSLMACDQAIMDQEAAFLEALALAEAFDTGDDSLRLFNADGREVAEFSVLEQARLTETRWEAVALNNGQNGLVGVLEDAIPFVIFDTDDNVSGNTGCNTFATGYSRDGDSMSIDLPASTMMACDQPIMDQEAQFFRALEQVASYELGHESLYLRAEDGSTLIWFRDAD